jgi:hypothetical protein
MEDLPHDGLMGKGFVTPLTERKAGEGEKAVVV